MCGMDIEDIKNRLSISVFELEEWYFDEENCSDILKEHLEGQSVVNIDLHSSEDLTNVISAAIRNIVVGLCVAALLIASSVICTTDMTPKILGIPALGFAGYAFAMVVSIFLTVRYLWSKRKKRK